jgi:L-ascorbate metabolism protein UlaG (beta-lactamase superfamily)
VAAVNGPVIGFVLRGAALPAVYVSGDNASAEVVREIAGGLGPFDAAVLFAGNAQVPVRWGGDAPLTLTPEAAVAAARLLSDAAIVPIHQDGWAHLTSGASELPRAFAAAGLEQRLRSLAPGETVDLGRA